MRAVLLSALIAILLAPSLALAMDVLEETSALPRTVPFWGVLPDSAGVAEVSRDSVVAFASARAESFVRARVGDRFYQAYISRDTSPLGVQLTAPVYDHGRRCLVHFDFVPPSNPTQVLRMTVHVDNTGGVPESFGVPDCGADPEECEFRVTRDDARSAAQRVRLRGDPDRWEYALDWYDFDGGPTYAWRIVPASEDRTTSEGAVIHGAIVIVDANDGRVAGPKLRLGRMPRDVKPAGMAN